MDGFGGSEFLILYASALALCGLDDLAIDLIYHIRRVLRRFTIYRRYQRCRADQLPTAQAAQAAILVPAWQEADVIGAMLKHLTQTLIYSHYRVYVGIYANDLDTWATVHAVSIRQPRIHMVRVPHDGPTSKADCLNHLFQAARKDTPDFYVIHDAEDVVHPLSLTVMNHLLDRADMIQLPVIAFQQPWYRFSGGHYCDEFAEAHGKELLAREAVCGHVPCAGVGCAFQAHTLEKLADQRSGQPFLISALTEDYEVAITLHLAGYRCILAHIHAHDTHMPVATREYFPRHFTSAIRQKARWYLGIVIQGTRQIGWQGDLGTRYALYRDRKAPFAALLSVGAYPLAPYIIIYAITIGSPLITALLWLNSTLLIWRLSHRVYFTARLHGTAYGLLAIPRAFWGNLINAAAAARAFWLAISAFLLKRPLSWDKTQHHFPSDAQLTRLNNPPDRTPQSPS